MKSAVFMCLFFVACFTAKAADSIIVKKDPRLDILSAKQVSINKLTSKMTSAGLYKGYRLQVLNTRNREEAFKMKAELLHQYPDQKTYMIFQSPYFKIRFGNFTERIDAERYKKELSMVYSQGVYVIEDAIEYTSKEDEVPATNR
jgi:hypothetical protein